MDTATSAGRRAAALLAATAFGVTAPLSVTSLADAAVQRPSHARDSDGDKMPDRWEARHGLDAHKANARRDADRDGLRNLAEFRDGTDPQDDDSDDDGIEDGDDDSPDGECTDDSSTSRHDGSDDCDDDADCDDDSSASSSDDDCDETAPPPARLTTYVVG